MTLYEAVLKHKHLLMDTDVAPFCRAICEAAREATRVPMLIRDEAGNVSEVAEHNMALLAVNAAWDTFMGNQK